MLVLLQLDLEVEQKQKAEALAKVELLETQFAQSQQALRDATDRALRDAQAKEKRISTLEREKVCLWVDQAAVEWCAVPPVACGRRLTAQVGYGGTCGVQDEVRAAKQSLFDQYEAKMAELLKVRAPLAPAQHACYTWSAYPHLTGTVRAWRCRYLSHDQSLHTVERACSEQQSKYSAELASKQLEKVRVYARRADGWACACDTGTIITPAPRCALTHAPVLRVPPGGGCTRHACVDGDPTAGVWTTCPPPLLLPVPLPSPSCHRAVPAAPQASAQKLAASETKLFRLEEEIKAVKASVLCRRAHMVAGAVRTGTMLCVQGLPLLTRRCCIVSERGRRQGGCRRGSNRQ